MHFADIMHILADVLKDFDAEGPVHKTFQPGIGPFGEPQIVRSIADRLTNGGLPARTRRTPDLVIADVWAFEFKIVRPYGDNGRRAENWSVNLLHPYPGNISLLGDALKLTEQVKYPHRALCVLGYEHNPPQVSLDPLLDSFELLAKHVLDLNLSPRIEEKRADLVHPVHQVLRCVGWQVHHSSSGTRLRI